MLAIGKFIVDGTEARVIKEDGRESQQQNWEVDMIFDDRWKQESVEAVEVDGFPKGSRMKDARRTGG